MNYVPFVYLITSKLTGEYYIGSHYGNRKNRVANPTVLWVTYFTTSKIVKKLIKTNGKEAFASKVLKIFTTKEEALAYEHRFLKRVNARGNPKFLNKSNGAMDFSGPHTEESRAKISKTKKERMTPEVRARMSAGSKKRPPQPKEQRDKMSISRKGTIGIKKDNALKFIPQEELNQFLSNGWVIEHIKPKNIDYSSRTGKSYINKDGKLRIVHPHEMEKFVSEGWKIGGLPRTETALINFIGRTWINNGTERKRVKNEELPTYLENMWVVGWTIK